jgi:ribosomal protein S18 acetylase RimI-like enzyme
MCEQGLCEWYGVFIKDQMAATMGIFLVDGVGNFQDVGTAPDFRRQGICGTAVYEISNHLLESKKVHTMMMTAVENYHAVRIYESVGFKPGEKSVCLLNPRYFK